ncbi:hypothetical protein [Streptomyces sp. NPDC058751]|uniref:hypothetical protein n=1 Tax=Streptomyces sp. NPDC058751 TaxID=3346623 RepID=UPI00368F0241
MRTFDPTISTSGRALADLFRTWCHLRGDDTDGEVDGGDLVKAVGEMFEGLGLNTGGPASQVDVTAGQHVFTVLGLSCDHSDELYVAGVLPGEHADAVIELKTDEDHFGRWAATFTTATADEAADMARRQVEDGDADGHGPRTHPDDVTPGRYVYPKNLLDDLRDALTEWFDDNPEHTRPSAVSFHITHDYDDGPAWSTYGPTFHYDGDPEREERRDVPVDRLPHVDFDHTAIADALIEIRDFEQPQDGDTLRIALRPSA